MIKKTILVGFCATILLLIPFSTISGPEITPMNDPPFEDPDGPTEGGLDDIQDWVDLANALYTLRFMNIGISEREISDFDGIIHLILWLNSLGYFAFLAICDFIEAFDIMELRIDGL